MFKTLPPKQIAAALVLSLAPAMAASEEWQFEGTFYLYAAETTTVIGDREGELSFSDALDNLDVAFMTTFSASRGPWTFVADYMLTDLSFESDTPGDAFSGAQTSAKTQILTGAALYKVYQEDGIRFDVGGGFRWFDTKTTLKLRSGALPKQRRTENDDWIDPILSARARFDLAENWTATALVDYGSFIDDRTTWQALLTADYKFGKNDDWILRAGYRYIKVENDDDDYFFEQSGPLIGIAYQF